MRGRGGREGEKKEWGKERGREGERERGRRGREETEVSVPVAAGILRALLGRDENGSGAVHRHLGGSSM